MRCTMIVLHKYVNVLLHVVALKEKLVAKREGNGQSFRLYVYTSCVVVVFLNKKVIHLVLNTK